MNWPKIVVLTGIDGSGKTTQARLLARQLEDAGLDVRYEHAIGPNIRLLRVLKDRVAERFLAREIDLTSDNRTHTKTTRKQGTREDPGPRERQGLRERIASRGLGLIGVVFLARAIWQSWVTPIANTRADVLVLDRYVYDDFVRVCWTYGYDASLVLQLLAVVPTPDLVVRLDAPAAVAWEREADGRTTLVEHAEKNRWYDTILGAVADRDEMVTVDTHTSDVPATHQRIVELVAERILDRTLSVIEQQW